MIRTFTSTDGVRHTLDLDAAQMDGMDCTDICSDGNREVSFETAHGTITCNLESLWHEIAGPTLSAREAALLLAECLARQILLQRQAVTLNEITRLLSLVGEVSTPSLGWLSTRLDPWSRQAMAAYDGSETMTEALSRILHQSPATIQIWARQLGLDTIAQSEEVVAPPVEVETGPLATPVQVEAVQADEAVVEAAEARKQFTWTPERFQQLEEALTTCTGITVIERARQIATLYHWPEASVRSKLYEMQRPRRAGQSAARESEHAETTKEEDQRVDQREAITV